MDQEGREFATAYLEQFRCSYPQYLSEVTTRKDGALSDITDKPDTNT
jgi:hypothetical protein